MIVTVVFATGSACNAISGVGDFGVGAELYDGEADGGDTTADPTPGDGTHPNDDDGRGDDDGDGTSSDGGTRGDPTDAATTGEDVVVVPEDGGEVDPSETRRVFVTEAKVQGAFGGLETADTMCADAASQASLGGSWVAWLSTPSVSAITRLTFEGAYVLLDGTLVVASKAQLTTGSINVPISLTENKAPVSSGENWVWTGTKSDGQNSSYTCSNWSTTNALTYGVVGNFGSSTTKWTNQGSPGLGFPAYGCQTWGHIYCFEK